MAKWDELSNKHVGETAIVIGNGPSLRDIPTRFLGKFPTFGTNRIYLLQGFIPTYYACVNPLVAEQYLIDIRGLQAEAKFITDQWASEIDGALPLHSSAIPGFSFRPDKYIYEGYTVTFVCLQLAFWMGFSTVLLVGVDHSYKFEGAPNQERAMIGIDPNHFSPDYFAGARWNNPDLVQSELAYQMAKTVFSAAGRQIINCSTQTALDVFPKGRWEDYNGS